MLKHLPNERDPSVFGSILIHLTFTLNNLIPYENSKEGFAKTFHVMFKILAKATDKNIIKYLQDRMIEFCFSAECVEKLIMIYQKQYKELQHVEFT